MAAKIIPKKSTVADKVPEATDLDAGEIAINLTDAKIYAKHTDNTIVNLSGAAELHTHTISQVTDLQSELDSKVDTSTYTASDVKTKYESNANTNAFTDSEKQKLSGIETDATADQTPSEILTAIKSVDGPSSGLDADTLDGKELSTIESEYQSYADSVSGGAALVWSIISSNTSALISNGYLVDCSAGPITLTLPASPSVGDNIGVSDFTKSSETNQITLARNGNNITGLAEDFIVNINGAGFTLVYTNSTVGWEIVSEVGVTTHVPYSYDETDDHITTNGDLSVNGALDVVSSATVDTISATTSITTPTIEVDTINSSNPSTTPVTLNNDLTVTGTITETSSIRYKSNIRKLDNSLDSVMKLNGVMYDKMNDKDNTGFIAEEVEKILPNLVTYKNGEVEGLQYTQIIAYLVESVKELNDKIERLEEEKANG